jgi:putative ABC transport system permease protein
MFKATLKSLLSRKLRLVLSGLAVVLSVMFMSAAFVLGDTLGRSFDALFSDVYTYTQLQVAHPAEDTNQGPAPAKPLPASVVDEVKSVPGVSSATGEVFSGDARVIGHNGKVVPNPSGNHFGTNWTGEDKLVQLRAGRGPMADNEVVINAELARVADFKIGDQIGILTLQPKKIFTIVGIVEYSGRDSIAGEHSVGFTEPVAQQLLLGQPGLFSDIDVKVAGGQSVSAVQQAIQAKLGPDYQVRTGKQLAADSANTFKRFLDVITYVLLGFASVAVLVGIFLIFNTFNIVVAQRTHELALLRAMGASSGQVLNSVVVEALLVGAVFSVIGYAVGGGLGALGAYLLTKLFGGLKVASVGFPLVGAIVSIGLGVLMTVAAAVIPAMRASGVPPIAALRDAERPDKPLHRLSISGAAVLAVGAAILGLGLSGSTSNSGWLILGGVVVCFFGVALLTPLLGKPVVGLLGRLFSWSTSGQLGRRNSARNPRRTAVTAAALMIGIAIITGISTVFASITTTFTNTTNELLRADLVIAGQQTSATPPAIDPAAITKTRALPEVQAVTAFSVEPAKVNGKNSYVVAYDDPRAATEILNVRPVAGRLEPLESGQFFTDDKTAADNGWTVGGPVTIELNRGGPKSYTLVGIYHRETGASGSAISWADEQAGFRIPTPQAAYVSLKPGADQAAVARTVDGFLADSPEVTVQTRDQYIHSIASVFNAILNVVQVLLLVAMFVAVLGVINTLVLSVVERTRELGMLRAIGLRRGQTAWMITVESMVISIFGALLGLMVGVALGAAAVRALKDQGIDTLTLPWGLMVLYLVAAAIVGAVAAIIPAYRAANLNVLAAISYE